MTRTRIILAALLAAIVLVLVAASDAGAANEPSPVYDAVASEVAGKPVSVWCEFSNAGWAAVSAEFRSPVDRAGFAPRGSSVAYLAPWICTTLRGLAQREDIGTYQAAVALLTLVHEAVHLRGIVNEVETECIALPLVRSIAVRHFGIAETVGEAYTLSSSRTVTLARTVLVKGKRVKLTRRVKVTSTTVAWRQVANPWLARLAVDAQRWHASLPAEYQGGC